MEGQEPRPLAGLRPALSRAFMTAQPRICVIVTSVIHFVPRKLHRDHRPRSVFSPEQRAQQTRATAESVRAKLPGARIVLIESGLRRDEPGGVPALVDQYVYLGDRFFARRACDSENTGLGEIVSLILGSRHLAGAADYFIKLSGRYRLSERFDPARWDLDKICVKKQGKNDKDMSTRLYGIPARYFSAWRAALWKSLPFMVAGRNRSLEHILPKFLPHEGVCEVRPIGVCGPIARVGENVDE